MTRSSQIDTTQTHLQHFHTYIVLWVELNFCIHREELYFVFWCIKSSSFEKFVCMLIGVRDIPSLNNFVMSYLESIYWRLKFLLLPSLFHFKPQIVQHWYNCLIYLLSSQVAVKISLFCVVIKSSLFETYSLYYLSNLLVRLSRIGDLFVHIAKYVNCVVYIFCLLLLFFIMVFLFLSSLIISRWNLNIINFLFGKYFVDEKNVNSTCA